MTSYCVPPGFCVYVSAVTCCHLSSPDLYWSFPSALNLCSHLFFFSPRISLNWKFMCKMFVRESFWDQHLWAWEFGLQWSPRKDLKGAGCPSKSSWIGTRGAGLNTPHQPGIGCGLAPRRGATSSEAAISTQGQLSWGTQLWAICHPSFQQLEGTHHRLCSTPISCACSPGC